MRKSILRLCALALLCVMSNVAMAAVPATFRFKVLDGSDKTVTLVAVTNKSEATIANIPSTVSKAGANAGGYKYEIEGLPSGEATDVAYKVVEIAAEAFASCEVLEEAIVPSTVTTIRTLAFNTNEDITICILDARNLQRVEKFAFMNKKSIPWETGFLAVNGWTKEKAWSNVYGGNNQVLFYESEDACYGADGSGDYAKSVMDLTALTQEGSQVLQPGAFAYTLLAKKIIWGTMTSVPDSLFLGATAWSDQSESTLFDYDDIEGLIFDVPTTTELAKVGKASFAFSDLKQFGHRDGINYLLPATLSEVGDYGFACCKKLDGPTGFRHNSTVTERIDSVGKYAFAGDGQIVFGDANYTAGLAETGFENIFATFENLTYAEGSFAKCGLTSIDLSASEQNKIPAYAFAGQGSGVSNLVLPAECTEVGASAFYADDIKVLNFPASLTKIGDDAFACSTANTATTFNLVEGWNANADMTYKRSSPNHWPSALDSIGKNAFYNRTVDGNIYTHGYITYNSTTDQSEYHYPKLNSQESFTVSGSIYAPAQADKTGNGLIPAMKSRTEDNYWYGNEKLVYPAYAAGTVTFANVNYIVGDQDSNTGLYAVTVAANPFESDNGQAIINAQFIGIAGDNGYVPAFYFSGFEELTTKTFANNIIFNTANPAEQSYKVDPLAENQMLWSAGQLNGTYTATELLPASTFKDFTALKLVSFQSGYTKIGEGAFEGCTALEEVSANIVTEIGKKAFYNDVALAKFSDFSKVTTIGENAFYGTTALKSDVVFPELTYLGNFAFQGSGVKAVTASGSAGVTLCANVFTGCQYLTKVDARAFKNFAGSAVFNNCPKLANATIGAAIIPANTFNNSGNEGDGLTVIANKATAIQANAFTGSKVVSFTGDALTTLDATAFRNCADLKSFSAKVLETIPAQAFVNAGKDLVMTIPAVKTILMAAFENSGVKEISPVENVIETVAEYAFKASKLESINLPKATSIASFAFQECANLETVVAGEGLTNIAQGTFQNAGADAKFEVTLNGVETIGVDAFNGSKLTTIDLPKLTTIVDATSFKDCSKLLSFKADVLTTIPASAFAGAGADGFAVNTPALTNIKYSAFAGSKLAKINAEKVDSIGDGAFEGTKLVNVNFPVVTDVALDAFKDCTALETAILNNGAETSPTFSLLGDNVFEGAGTTAEGKSFTVTTAATTIYENAFQNSNVVTVNATKATTLDAGAFTGCSTIKTFNAPELTEIPDSTFMNSSIETAELPKVKKIGKDAFNISNLKELNLGEEPALETIGANAFRMTKLENIKFPATLATMGAGAFAISTLKKADFSSATALTEIPARAFAYCASLKDVNLGNVTSVGQKAFFSTAIEEITLPATLTTFAGGAFSTESIQKVNVSYDVANIPILTVDAFAPNEAGNYDAVLHVTGNATREDYLNHDNYWKKFFIDNDFVIKVNNTPIASDEEGVFTLVDNVGKVEIKSPCSGKFKYVRNFTSTVWQCWFVPFDIEAGAVEGIKFAMLYDTDNTGGATRIEYKEITDPSTIIKANVPYLVKPEVAKEYTFEAVKLEKTVTTTTAKVSNLKNIYTFQGTYAKKDGKNYETAPWYGLNAAKGNFAKAMGVNAYINAYRFYMTISGNDNPVDYVKVVVLDDEDATGISDINSNEIAEGAMFDLQGRKINAPVKGQVYIQNGVKKLAK